MSSIVESIPWMPERAWTTARAKCAISGLTRSGFTPDHVQLDLPCDPSTCLAEPNITWVWEGEWQADPYSEICLLDLDDGSFGDLDKITLFEILDVRDGEDDRVIASGATMAECCFTPNDWGYSADPDPEFMDIYLRYYWGEGSECFGLDYGLTRIEVVEPV